MKKLLLALALIGLSAAPVHAGHRKLLYFKPGLVLGFGDTEDREPSGHKDDRSTFHIATGVMLFSVDRQGIFALGGVGGVIDFYDYQHSDAALRDRMRNSSGSYSGNFIGGDAATPVITIIPVRVMCFEYQFSVSKHVRSAGVDRGRLHMLTFDVAGFIRALKAK